MLRGGVTQPANNAGLSWGRHSTRQQRGVVVGATTNNSSNNKSTRSSETDLQRIFWGNRLDPIFSNLSIEVCATKRSTLCTMIICLINAQSVMNKVTPLSDYIIEHGFDIAAFTETWLCNTPDDDQIIRVLTIPGYKFTYVSRRQHKNTTARGGGVAILHKSIIKMASKSS